MNAAALFTLPASPYVLALLAFTVGVLAGFGAWLLARLAPRLSARTASTLDDELAKGLPMPVALVVGILSTTLALALVARALPASWLRESHRALAVAFVLAVAWGALRVLRIVLDRMGRRHERFQPATRVSGRLISVVLYLLVGLTALSQYGIAVTPILTALGVATLAVGLALQDTLGNFFGGIWIQTGRSLQPGHYVRMEMEKLEGYVEAVGWRTTRIRNLSGNTIVVPNKTLAQAIVTDYYLPAPDMGIGLKFRVAFEAEPDHVLAVLLEEARAVAQGNPGVVPGAAPSAALDKIDADCYVFSVGLRVTEFAQQFGVLNTLRMRVLARFRKEGIRIPYPTRHNIQEPVQPPAERVPTSPGGFSPPHRRPRPRRMAPAEQPKDPRQLEAEKAQGEILAQQHQDGKPVDEQTAAGKDATEQAKQPDSGA